METVRYKTTKGEEFTINHRTMTLTKSDGNFDIKMITLLGKNQRFKAWISKKGEKNSFFEFVTQGEISSIE